MNRVSGRDRRPPRLSGMWVVGKPSIRRYEMVGGWGLSLSWSFAEGPRASFEYIPRSNLGRKKRRQGTTHGRLSSKLTRQGKRRDSEWEPARRVSERVPHRRALSPALLATRQRQRVDAVRIPRCSFRRALPRAIWGGPKDPNVIPGGGATPSTTGDPDCWTGMKIPRSCVQAHQLAGHYRRKDPFAAGSNDARGFWFDCHLGEWRCSGPFWAL